MSVATFRFHSELASFLPRERRETVFDYDCARAATLKQAIESLGVPHTEVGLAQVNGHAATLARTVRDSDLIEVFPHAPGTSPFEAPLAFVADAHLGGLARMLRMLGFDTVYDNGLDDAEIVARSGTERRVVLTRDRELLKRRDVLRGAFVHALKPEAQLREIATRYALAQHMRPFSLCLHCNLPLRPADAACVSHGVPERIRQHYSVFTRCAGCGRVYWEGSHWQRMREVLASALAVDAAQVS
jgi:uncharacterized protein with PIN domain